MSISDCKETAIRRGAVRLRAAVAVAMGLLCLAVVLAWIGDPLGVARVEVQNSSGLIDPRLGGSVAILLIELALFRLTQMLNAIASGDLFSSRVVSHFRGFAFWLLTVGAPLRSEPRIDAATVRGTHHLSLILDLNHILTVGITLLLFLLARLLERARQLDEEMREIV